MPRSGLASRRRRPLQLPEPVAAPLDVQHVAAVQQPVQDRRGQHFVTGQQLGPVPDPFVGGNQHAATLIAVADQAEEQRGLQAVHRLKAHHIDNQKPGVYIVLPASSGRRQACKC